MSFTASRKSTSLNLSASSIMNMNFQQNSSKPEMDKAVCEPLQGKLIKEKSMLTIWYKGFFLSYANKFTQIQLSNSW